MKYRILMKVDDLPDRSIVTKRSGEKRFILKRELSFWCGKKRRVQRRPDGYFYLVDRESGNIQEIAEGKEVLCEMDLPQLCTPEGLIGEDEAMEDSRSAGVSA